MIGDPTGETDMRGAIPQGEADTETDDGDAEHKATVCVKPMRRLATHNATRPMKPSTLSHYHDVRKNTISSMLNGLEENGLVERKTHPKDRRASLVRITAKGRELVETSAPQRFKFMNQAVEGLSIQERDQLILLLDKLRHSILTKTDIVPPMCH